MRNVLNLMIQHRIGCVLIVEQGRPVGIFSERDALVRLNTRAAELADRPIAVMREYVTLQATEAAQLTLPPPPTSNAGVNSGRY